MGSGSGRNIVVTGFMGTGKTTVGRILADRIGYGFVDTDELIESRAGAIPAIFEREGERAFREMERSVARELAASSGLVIATGGAMMLDGDCARSLAPGAEVVCLTAGPEAIFARIAGSGTSCRPLLDTDDPGARVGSLLAERAEGYARFTAVDTEHRSPGEVADAVLEVLGLT